MDLAVIGADGRVDAPSVVVDQLKREDFPVWSTKDYVEQFFFIAWLSAVLSWYLQTLFVFLAELLVLSTLVITQTLALVWMVWYLKKQYKV